MHRLFFEVPADADEITVTGEELRHLQVLRLRVGESICISDGQNFLYDGTVVQTAKDFVRFSLSNRQPITQQRSGIVLFQALCKADKNEFIVQKAVELGADEIVFFGSRNCVSKIEGKAEQKLVRWNRIAKSAAEQTGADRIPEVNYISDFEQMLQAACVQKTKLFFYEHAQQKLSQYWQSVKNPETVAVVIGSEGGFTEEENTLAQQRGFASLSLGKHILRAETAPIAVLSVLSAYKGLM